MQYLSNITHARNVLEERDEVQQLVVGGVVEPRDHRHGVVGVEQIRRGRVVHNDRLWRHNPPPRAVSRLHKHGERTKRKKRKKRKKADLADVAAEAGEVLDVIAAVQDAVLAEQAVVKRLVLV